MKKSRLDRLDEFLQKQNMSDDASGTFKTIDSMLSRLGLERKKEREETISRIQQMVPAVVVNATSRQNRSYIKNCIENKKEFVLYFKKVPRGYHAGIYLPIKK